MEEVTSKVSSHLGETAWLSFVLFPSSRILASFRPAARLSQPTGLPQPGNYHSKVCPLPSSSLLRRRASALVVHGRRPVCPALLRRLRVYGTWRGRPTVLAKKFTKLAAFLGELLLQLSVAGLQLLVLAKGKVPVSLRLVQALGEPLQDLEHSFSRMLWGSGQGLGNGGDLLGKCRLAEPLNRLYRFDLLDGADGVLGLLRLRAVPVPLLPAHHCLSHLLRSSELCVGRGWWCWVGMRRQPREGGNSRLGRPRPVQACLRLRLVEGLHVRSVWVAGSRFQLCSLCRRRHLLVLVRVILGNETV